jgi:hypothetical protein
MLHKKVGLVFFTLYLIKTCDGLFYFTTNNGNTFLKKKYFKLSIFNFFSSGLIDYMPPLSNGILDQNQFNFTSFNISDGFPIKIELQAIVLSSFLRITLNQVEGLIYTSSIYSQVYFASNSNTNEQNFVS